MLGSAGERERDRDAQSNRSHRSREAKSRVSGRDPVHVSFYTEERAWFEVGTRKYEAEVLDRMTLIDRLDQEFFKKGEVTQLFLDRLWELGIVRVHSVYEGHVISVWFSWDLLKHMARNEELVR